MTTILQNWHFMRVFRAAFAVFAFIEATRSGQTMLYAIGGILAFQAIFDVGCCGSAGCAAPQKPAVSKNDPAAEDAVFEEVK